MKTFLQILIFLCLPVVSCFAAAPLVKQPPIATSVKDTVPAKKAWKLLLRPKVFELPAYATEDQNNLYQSFSRSGSAFDFLKMAMENKDPIARLYAFRAVAEKMDEIPLELIEKFRSDSTVVRVRTGDVIQEIPVSEVANGFLK